MASARAVRLSPSVEKQKLKWRLFIFISRESKWGTLQSAGNPRCAVPAEIHSICTDRLRPGLAAGLQVSPTSDTSQSVAILMNKPHWNSCVGRSRNLKVCPSAWYKITSTWYARVVCSLELLRGELSRGYTILEH